MNTITYPSHRSTRWLLFFGLILSAWLVLFMGASNTQPANTGISTLGSSWAALCSATPLNSHFITLFAMWALMSIAMMGPTLFPALSTYEDLISANAASSSGFAALILGYLSVWLVFSLLACLAQMLLSQFLLSATSHPAASSWVTAGLFTLAGAYQFSPQKQACLQQCQQPLTFFMQHWRSNPAGSLFMGARLGLVCVACCWALMSLALVSGAMSLVWMGLATVLMVAEKLPQIGNTISKPIGSALLIAAAGFIGRALAMSAGT